MAVQKANVYKRIIKTIVGVGHCVVVNPESCINVEFFLLDFLLSPRFSPESSNPELAVVEISHGKFFTLRVLLDVFKLDVLVEVDTNFLLKCQLVAHLVRQYNLT